MTPRRPKPTRSQVYANNACRAFRHYIANHDVEQFHIGVEWIIRWLGRAGKDRFDKAPKPRPRKETS